MHEESGERPRKVPSSTGLIFEGGLIMLQETHARSMTLVLLDGMRSVAMDFQRRRLDGDTFRPSY